MMMTNLSRKARFTRGGAIVLAAGAAIGLTLNYSQSAFTASTSNSGNALASGTLSITSDLPATAMFNTSGMAPGDSTNKCIALKYTGNVAGTSKLDNTYMAASNTGLLGDYLKLDVAVGVRGQTCTNATYTPLITNNSLANFEGLSSGLPPALSWAPTATNETLPVKITLTLKDDNNAQGKTSNPTFTWTVKSK